MTRYMLCVYNVSDAFWVESMNIVFHASNRLYCHWLLNKTPYDLLVGRNTNISYFRVFGCKCSILNRGTRLRKLRRNVMQIFSLELHIKKSLQNLKQNSCHSLRSTCVEFDESNGSQNEDGNLDDVRVIQLNNAIKNMTIDDLK